MLRELRKSESGVTTIEFGLIAALVAVVAIPALVAVGDELQNPFSTASSTISGDGGSGGDPIVSEADFALTQEMNSRGYELRARFPVYPEYILRQSQFLPPSLLKRLRLVADPVGYFGGGW